MSTSTRGVTLTNDGARFCVRSAHATHVDVCLFDGADRETARHRMKRAGDVHTIALKGVKPGQRYGYRADGPWHPESGHRFDHSKLLLDPYAPELDRHFRYDFRLGQFGVDTGALVPKGLVPSDLPRLPLRNVSAPGFIYEVNVRTLTKQHEGVPVGRRGTVAALAERAVINHMQSLGVDTIELMPLTAWMDERHLPPLGLRNAWGYNPVSFFAPDPRVAPGGLAELRTTISRLHEAGFNVILDVVLNHTAESDAQGGTVSLRGLDNTAYYRLHGGHYVNDTGCGNTLALDHPVAVELCVAALRHWVECVGIDGFRFDLATVMGREPLGYRREAPLLAAIEADSVLSTRILIAEPWDVGPGGYQLGNFPAKWYEWNDKYRDDVRRFWRGDHWSANALATRLAGSSDVMSGKPGPSRSINFLAAHDGFTLRDVMTYAAKDNHANGENNRDGKTDEVTWVGGDIRAILATLFLSRGTPMLTAGDEFGRTQRGNNNAYAQDNEITWLDWTGADRSLSAYVASLVKLRSRFAEAFCDQFLTDADSTWFGEGGEKLDWENAGNRFVGLGLKLKTYDVALVINGSQNPVTFSYLKRRKWKQVFCSTAGKGCPAKSVALFVTV